MPSENGLFSPLIIREITFRNRIAVSPMCEYSSIDGFANDWHLVHLGSRAVGGAALVMTEATAVEERGRITPGDLGIYKNEHVANLARIAQFVKEHGAVPGIQLAHAGRKASCRVPWEGGLSLKPEQGAWQTVAPSALPFRDSDPVPRELAITDIYAIVDAFVLAARRALAAGFQVIEIHSAHGYLLHEFLSPLSNHRTDEYGGTFDNRTRFLREVITAVRAVTPEGMPLFVRISATDWKEGGWDIDESVKLAAELKKIGVDLIDCSSGGLASDAKIQPFGAYQVPFAERIRNETTILTGAVGMINDASQADEIIRSGQADIVLLARAMLRDPYWPLHAAQLLGAEPEAPVQYQRAFQKA
jgi:2,4-dienoyl-CoA reductase-like NADH-dependent reductase (Old Yellow Enzyme family)